MSRLLTINDRRICFSMDWIELDSNIKTSKSQIKQFRRSLNPTYEIISPNSGAYGVISTRLVNEKKTVYSAIAWLCVVSQTGNAIAVQPIDDKNIWIGAVQQGCPFRGCDQIVPPDQVKELITQLLEQIDGAELFGYGEYMDELALLSNGVMPFDIEQVWIQHPPQKHFALHKTGVPQWLIALLTGMVLVLGLAGAAIYIQLQAAEKERARQIAEQEAAAEVARIARLPKPDQVMAEQFVKWFNGVSRIPTAAYAAQIFEKVGQQPLESKGWKLLSVACEKGAELCEMQYKRDQLGAAVKPESGFVPAAEMLKIKEYNVLFDFGIKNGPNLKSFSPDALARLWAPGLIKAQMIPFLQELDDLKCQVNIEEPVPVPVLVASSANAAPGNAPGAPSAPGAAPGAPQLVAKLPPDLKVSWVKMSITCDVAYMDVLKSTPAGSYIDSFKLMLDGAPQVSLISYWFEITHQPGDSVRPAQSAAPFNKPSNVVGVTK